MTGLYPVPNSTVRQAVLGFCERSPRAQAQRPLQRFPGRRSIRPEAASVKTLKDHPSEQRCRGDHGEPYTRINGALVPVSPPAHAGGRHHAERGHK